MAMSISMSMTKNTTKPQDSRRSSPEIHFSDKELKEVIIDLQNPKFDELHSRRQQQIKRFIDALIKNMKEMNSVEVINHIFTIILSNPSKFWLEYKFASTLKVLFEQFILYNIPMDTYWNADVISKICQYLSGESCKVRGSFFDGFLTVIHRDLDNISSDRNQKVYEISLDFVFTYLSGYSFLPTTKSIRILNKIVGLYKVNPEKYDSYTKIMHHYPDIEAQISSPEGINVEQIKKLLYPTIGIILESNDVLKEQLHVILERYSNVFRNLKPGSMVVDFCNVFFTHKPETRNIAVEKVDKFITFLEGIKAERPPVVVVKASLETIIHTRFHKLSPYCVFISDSVNSKSSQTGKMDGDDGLVLWIWLNFPSTFLISKDKYTDYINNLKIKDNNYHESLFKLMQSNFQKKNFY